MDMLTNLIVAYAIIASPHQDGKPLHPLTAIAVSNAAVQLQILDERETRYTFVRESEFASDLRMVRCRFQDLKNAPPLEDAQRLPGRQWVTEQRNLNRQFQTIITERFDVRDLQPIISDLECRWRLYDQIADANCQYYYVTVRRLALLNIREIVGPQVYYSGIYPPALPLENFQEIP